MTDNPTNPGGQDFNEYSRHALTFHAGATTSNSFNNPANSFTAGTYDSHDSRWLWDNILVTMADASVTSVRTAETKCGNLATAADAMRSALIRLVGPVVQPDQSLWTGHAQAQFQTTIDKLLNFTDRLARTTKFLDHTSMHWVTGRLADSMDEVRHYLHDATELQFSTYTNNGDTWTLNSMEGHNFDQDNLWLTWADQQPVTMHTYRWIPSAQIWGHGETKLTARQLEVWLENENFWWNENISNKPAWDEWLKKVKVAFLNHVQHQVFVALANTASQRYAHYYPYIPQPPSATELDRNPNPSMPDPAFSPVGLDPGALTPPALDETALGNALAANPLSLSNVPTDIPSPNSSLANQSLADPSLTNPPLTNPPVTGLTDGTPTSLASVAPLTAAPTLDGSTLNTPGALSGRGLVPGPVSSPGPSVTSPGVNGSTGAITGPSGVSGPGVNPQTLGTGSANVLGRQLSAGLHGPARALSSEAALAAQNAARTAGAGMYLPPMYPPHMPAGGAGQGHETPGGNFLVEDEQFWTVQTDNPPPVIGES